MHSFQNFIVWLTPNHPLPLETRIWKLVVRALIVTVTQLPRYSVYKKFGPPEVAVIQIGHNLCMNVTGLNAT